MFSTEEPDHVIQLPGIGVITKSVDLSNYAKHLFDVIVWTILCGCIGVMGIVTNIINLIVFVRQGIWTESVTASLAGLSLSDLCCDITMFFHSVNFAICLEPPPSIPWDPLSIMFIASGWPRVMFTRVTCWITAYVALERCMCVVLPFKVKQMFTAPRSIVVIVTIFTVTIASYLPIFYSQRLENDLDPATNVTKLRMVFTANKEEIEVISSNINDIILPTISMSIAIICTQLTIARLNASSKWRKKNANSGLGSSETGTELKTYPKKQDDPYETKQRTVTSGKTSSKETKVVKMVTFICTIFIICNLPCVILFYVKLLVPGFHNSGRYNNLYYSMFALDFMLETINSSINIVVYYNMSTKYKQEFRTLFGMKDKI